MKGRLQVVLGWTVLAGALAGCYALQPALGPEPQLGDQLAFDITDQGRVALGGSMGPEISRVEGRLLDDVNGEYLVAVSAVRTIRGGVQVWTGERVRIDKQFVARRYEQRFSSGRTIALGAVVAGGAWFLFGRSLIVRGRGDPPVIPPDTGITVIVRP